LVSSCASSSSAPSSSPASFVLQIQPSQACILDTSHSHPNGDGYVPQDDFALQLMSADTSGPRVTYSYQKPASIVETAWNLALETINVGPTITGTLSGAGVSVSPGAPWILGFGSLGSGVSLTGSTSSNGMHGTFSGELHWQLYALNYSGTCTAADHGWSLQRLPP
jgi:hypothetical protein